MARFLKSVHYLRGIAILMIVGVHARGYPWEWKNPDNINFFVTLFDNGTILFVFIAGFLFQHNNHETFSYPAYLKQKAKFVVLPYLIFSIPIIAARLFLGSETLPLQDGFDQEPVLYKVFYFLITGLHMVPFWFMPMIFLFYITSFLLHRLDNQTFYRYALPVVVIFGLFTFRPANNANPLLAFIHFLPIYFTGMWASYNLPKILSQKDWPIYLLAFIYIVISALELTDLIPADKRLSVEEVWQTRQLVFNIYVFKALILCIVLLLLFNKIEGWNSRLLNILAEYSFGIYFIHFYFISSYRQIASPLQFTVGAFILYFILIVAASILSIFIVKKITGKYSRYLTGS